MLARTKSGAAKRKPIENRGYYIRFMMRDNKQKSLLVVAILVIAVLPLPTTVFASKEESSGESGTNSGTSHDDSTTKEEKNKNGLTEAQKAASRPLPPQQPPTDINRKFPIDQHCIPEDDVCNGRTIVPPQPQEPKKPGDRSAGGQVGICVVGVGGPCNGDQDWDGFNDITGECVLEKGCDTGGNNNIIQPTQPEQPSQPIQQPQLQQTLNNDNNTNASSVNNSIISAANQTKTGFCVAILPCF